jgi:hypothetical protein
VDVFWLGPYDLGETYDEDVHGRTETLVEQERLLEIVGLLHLGTESEDGHVTTVLAVSSAFELNVRCGKEGV